jgi:hypothetical protein
MSGWEQVPAGLPANGLAAFLLCHKLQTVLSCLLCCCLLLQGWASTTPACCALTAA